MRNLAKGFTKGLVFCLVVSGLIFGTTVIVNAQREFRCNNSAACTALLTPGSPVAPGDTVLLTANIGPGVPGGNAVNWNIPGIGGVTFDCNGRGIAGTGVGIGIQVNGAGAGSIIRNCNISGFAWGIRLNAISDFTISDNTVTNSMTGIQLENAKHNELLGNTCTNNTVNGISLFTGSDSNKVEDNCISDNLNGIDINQSVLNTIKNNDIWGNSRHGVRLLEAGHNYIGDNNICDNEQDGLKIVLSNNNDIFDNDIFNNVRYGIHLFDSSNNQIDSNSILDNGRHGVFDHPIQPIGAPGRQIPGPRNIVVPNGVACNPAPARPWQNPKVGSPFWCIGTSILQDGGDPPIYGNIMAFPTPERFIAQDLNGDGDTNDTVLRYMNLETGEVVNTGLIASGHHHAIDIYENIIAFVGEGDRIRYYDINTGTVGETGATGSRPSIYGNIIAFASEGTIRYFDLSAQTLVDTKVSGSSPAIYQDLIAFHISGPTPTIWTYDLRTGVAVGTGIIGRDATLYKKAVAFVTRESAIAEDLNGDGDLYDYVIRYYDLANQTMTNTGAVGRYPALYGSQIAFATSERTVNQDLNGDGKIVGKVIRYYDLETGQVVNTQELGTEPDIYDDTISFYLWESWTALDLNGDGDRSDPIVGSFTLFNSPHDPVHFAQ